MGINDRDYYRDDESESFSYSTRRVSDTAPSSNRLIKVLIALNVALFVMSSMSGGLRPVPGSMFEQMSLHLPGIKNYELWRFVTYGFAHGNLNHLLFNMLGLWVFGRLVESVRGWKETLGFYIAALIISGAAQLAIGAVQSPHQLGLIIGASGAVCGLTALSAFYYGRLKMYSLFFPFGLELRWMALVYVAIDTWGALRGGAPVAHWAHLGGAAFGALYFLLGLRIVPNGLSRLTALRKRPESTPWQQGPARSTQSAQSADRPEVRIYEPPTEGLAADLDRVLDKINREGKASLTAAENEVLQRASQAFRQHR